MKRTQTLAALAALAFAMGSGPAPAAGLTFSCLLLLPDPGDLCVTYAYDANGNLTTRSSMAFAASGLLWGNTTFGCFTWGS